VFVFLTRRVAFAAVLVVVIASAAFLLTHAVPGDYFTDFAPGGTRRASAERAAAGFDRPLLHQYASWLAGAVRLDLGTSLKFGQPVHALVWPRAKRTALLGLCALLLATIVGIPLGVCTGARWQGTGRRLIRGISSVLLALPSMVVVLALLAIAARLGWLPPPGTGLANLLLPALALALPASAFIERTHSHAMHRALEEPCILAASARGVPRQRLVWKHAMRSALSATLATYAVTAGALLSGSFTVELVADWPGLAQLTAEALRARDPYLLGGCAAAAAGVLATVVLVTDLVHYWADPRLRQS
jgi:peptide/nickel transport system permease protein